MVAKRWGLAAQLRGARVEVLGPDQIRLSLDFHNDTSEIDLCVAEASRLSDLLLTAAASSQLLAQQPTSGDLPVEALDADEREW